MILEVYDRSTYERLTLIRTYSFVQYTKYFNDIGEFKIIVPITEPSLQTLINIHNGTGNFILFDKEVMGVIKYVHRQHIDSPQVEISGYLINHILEFRSHLVMTMYHGKIFDIERQMVNDLFINPTDTNRTIDLIVLDDVENVPDSETIRYQDTGHDCAEEIAFLNDPRGYGYDLVPEIQNYNPLLDKPTNIKQFTFVCKVGSDRSKGNTDGNNPVVFSMSLNNISDLEYENNATSFRNYVLVAGEDSGENRRTVAVGDTTATGLDRLEVFIDARDIQSEDEEGQTIPESEYLELLRERGLDKMKDYKMQEDFGATVIQDGNLSFTYGVSFFLGDWVTVIDEQIGVEAKMQVIGITKSLTENGEITDLVFGNNKMTISKRFKQLLGGR